MSTQKLQLTGGTTSKRRELDFYPTPPPVTQALLLSGVLPLKDGAVVWEPACGDGAMSRVLEERFTVLSTDLSDECYGLGGMDFTTTAIDQRVDAVITNPPFYAAEDFIRRGLEAAPVVALLFKSQFWHAKRRLSVFTDHPPAFVLPLTWRPDFLGKAKSAPTMEVLWTVWIEGVTECRYQLLLKP